MRIQDMMSRNVVSISPGTAISAARELLKAKEIDHLVVMEGQRLAGVLASSDLDGADPDQPVSSVMTRDVVTIESNALVRRAAGVMRGRAIGCLPVVDDEKLLGIVTTSDFLDVLSKGEIHAAPQRERVVLRKRGPRADVHHGRT